MMNLLEDYCTICSSSQSSDRVLEIRIINRGAVFATLTGTEHAASTVTGTGGSRIGKKREGVACTPVPPRAPPRFLFHSSPRDHDGRRRSGSAFVRAG